MKIDYSSICEYSVGMPSDSNKEIKYILAGNGSLEIRENEIAVFSMAVKKIPGLDSMEEGVKLKLPPIPLELLFQTIAFFRKVYQLHQSEAIIQIYWNRTKKEYYCFCPEQMVSGVAVNFKRNKKMDASFLLVLDIHSHNVMNAFFSQTDDSDEKEARLYGVIGKINDPMPQMLFRASSGGSIVDIPVDKIFDLSFDFPSHWLKQISQKPQMKIMGGENYLWDSKILDKKWENWEMKGDILDKWKDSAIPLETDSVKKIDVVELREQLLQCLSDDDKNFLATELWGSLNNSWEVDNGGYKDKLG